jgi:hypothetical protein
MEIPPHVLPLILVIVKMVVHRIHLEDAALMDFAA